MDVRSMRYAPLWGTALIFTVGLGAQPPKRTAQAEPQRVNNAWMKTPMDPSSPDDLTPYFRHLRDEFWDRLGMYGVLTPKTVVHVSSGDYAGPFDEPDVPELKVDQAALVAKFVRYRTSLSASGRAIYTDITLSVEHVFQDAAHGHALATREITLGVEGGTVRSPQGTISFLTDPRTDLVEPGGTYLFYLLYMPEGDFYIGRSAWDLSDGTANPVGYPEVRKVKTGGSKLVGLKVEQLVRTLDEHFSSNH